jgi:hypothetical protein
MTTLAVAIACAACTQLAPLPQGEPHPALYSFADVYRLTVSGAMAGQPRLDPSPDAPIRVAVARAASSEPRFSIAPVRAPEKWLLVLAGLALAGWVAHRRLAHGL